MTLLWKEKKTNAKELAPTGVTRIFVKTFRKAQQHFVEHINRKSGIEKLAVHEKILEAK